MTTTTDRLINAYVIIETETPWGSKTFMTPYGSGAWGTVDDAVAAVHRRNRIAADAVGVEVHDVNTGERWFMAVAR